MAHFSFDLPVISRSLTAQLVVVMPVYNEEANITEVITQWSSCLRDLGIAFQILALNDGSKDRTHEMLLALEGRDPEALCVVSKPNGGHGVTCRIGYDIAVQSPAEWVLQIDSDGQCEPKHFSNFWSRREQFDCIFGVRKTRDDGLARRLTSAICRVASSLLGGQDLKDPNVPYRLIRRDALEKALRFIPSSFNIHNVALTYVLKKLSGLRWSYVEIHFP